MPPRVGKDGLTIRQAGLVKAIVKGKTLAAAAKEAGYSGSESTLRVEAHKTLKKPNVRAAIEKALDKAGATVEKTAKVIAEAMDATETAMTKHGDVVDLGADHKTRLKAAELGGRFRKLLTPKEEGGGPVMNIGFFVLKGMQERGLGSAE